MDPVQSWIDAKEVRRMAESLMAPPPEVDETVVDAGYGDDFEGFAEPGSATERATQQQTPDAHSDARLESQPEPRPTPQPDGRPHAQKQFITASQAPPTQSAPAPTLEPSESPEPSSKTAAGNALADAKRLAESSGMLESGEGAELSRDDTSDDALQPATEQAEPQDVWQSENHLEQAPVSPVSPVGAGSAPHDSPFQIAADQAQNLDDPLAYQVPVSEDRPEPDARPFSSSPQASGFKPDLTPEPVTEPTPEPPAEPTPETTSEPDSGNMVLEPESESAPAPSSPPSTPVAHGVDEWADKPLAVNPLEYGENDGQARGPFLSRLQKFSTIIRRDLGAKAMFLIDNEGQILLDEVDNAKLIQVARTLANASYRASRQTAGAAAVGNLHVKIGANATLEVVPVETRYGLLVLGAIFPAPIGAERVIQLADVLSQTIEPGE